MCQRQNPSGADGPASFLAPGQWQLSTTFLHWYSDKHYVGTQPNFGINGKGPFNTMDQFNVSASYGLTPRWELSVDLPILFHGYNLIRPLAGVSRTPVPVQAGVNGIGDITVSAGYWLFPVDASPSRGNLQLSLGLQIPSGNDAATFGAYGRLIPAEWSVQPGDGSWGIVPTVRGFLPLGRGYGLFGVATYLITPRDTTGTPAFFPSLSNPHTSVVNSSADQFFAEGGLAAPSPVPWLTPTLGYIVSGVPRRDLIGGSDGFRRPATLAYLAPGISLVLAGQSFSISLPMLAYENIKPPVNPSNGRDLTDATVPGFMFSINHSFRFGGPS